MNLIQKLGIGLTILTIAGAGLISREAPKKVSVLKIPQSQERRICEYGDRRVVSGWSGPCSGIVMIDKGRDGTLDDVYSLYLSRVPLSVRHNSRSTPFKSWQNEYKKILNAYSSD